MTLKNIITIAVVILCILFALNNPLLAVILLVAYFAFA
jgi:hypothetical protein